MFYLIQIIVPESKKPVLDGLFQTAASFLGALGAVKRTDVGSYVRAGRKSKERELLRLVEFAPDKAEAPDAARATALESVLRTLATSGSTEGEVRVFLKVT